jgi:D-xylose transport system permease protein
VAFGLINGVLVQYVGINAFIVSLATLTAGRGLVLILTDARTISPNSTALFGLMNGTWAVNIGVVAGIVALLAAGGIALTRGARGAWASAAGAGVVLIVAGLVGGWSWALEHSVYYMFVVALLVAAVLRFTVVGRRLYATGGNADAARLSGIAVDRYKVLPFVLNGFAAACVGVLFAAKLGAVNPDALQGAELTVLAAAILGGTSLFGGAGSVEKSVVGALILFVLSNGFNVLNLGANYQGVIQGLVVLAAAATYTLASKKPGRARRGRRDATAETAASSAAGGSSGAVPAPRLSSDGA